MKKIFVLLFSTLFFGQALYAEDSLVTERMIGKEISARKSPYVIVQIKYKNKDNNEETGKENGILISKKHVLMGAHGVCSLLKDITDFKVIAGNQTIDVVRYDFPDSFKCDSNIASCPDYDVLILTLKKSVKNKTFPIVSSAKKIKKGVYAKIAGYGDDFKTLKQSETVITEKEKSFFLLAQFNNYTKYSGEEGSAAVTIKVKNKKKKKVDAIAGMATCYLEYFEGPNLKTQDRILMLQDNKIKKFIKNVTRNKAKFM